MAFTIAVNVVGQEALDRAADSIRKMAQAEQERTNKAISLAKMEQRVLEEAAKKQIKNTDYLIQASKEVAASFKNENAAIMNSMRSMVQMAEMVSAMQAQLTRLVSANQTYSESLHRSVGAQQAANERQQGAVRVMNEQVLAYEKAKNASENYNRAIASATSIYTQSTKLRERLDALEARATQRKTQEYEAVQRLSAEERGHNAVLKLKADLQAKVAVLEARRTPEIQKLIAKVKELEAAESSAHSATRSFSTGLGSVNQLTASMRAGMTALGMQFGIYTSGTILAAGATYGFINAVKDMIATGAKFEAELAVVNAVMGTNQQQFETLRQASIDLAASSRYTGTEVAQAFREMGMSGMSFQESLTGIRAVLSLASIGNMDFAQATDIATNIVFGFNLATSDLTHVVDVMAKTVTSSNQDIKQLGNTMSYAAPIASSFGVSLEFTAAMTEVLANSGIKASRAGTALRRTLTALLGESESATAELAELGVHVNTLAGDMDDELLRVLKALNTATHGATTNVGNLTKAVGLYAAPGFLKLVAAAGEGVDSLEEIYKATQDVEGAAYSMQKKIEDVLAVDWKILQSALEAVKLGFFQIYDGGLRELVQNTSAWVQAVASSKETILAVADNIKVAFWAVAAAVGATLSSMILLGSASLFNKILTGFDLITGAVKGTASAAIISAKAVDRLKGALMFAAASTGLVGIAVALYQVGEALFSMNKVTPLVAGNVRNLSDAAEALKQNLGYENIQKENEALAVRTAEQQNSRAELIKQLDALRQQEFVFQKIYERGGDVAAMIAKNTKEQEKLTLEIAASNEEYQKMLDKLIQQEAKQLQINKIAITLDIDRLKKELVAAEAMMNEAVASAQEALDAKAFDNPLSSLFQSLDRNVVAIFRETGQEIEDLAKLQALKDPRIAALAAMIEGLRKELEELEPQLGQVDAALAVHAENVKDTAKEYTKYSEYLNDAVKTALVAQEVLAIPMEVRALKAKEDAPIDAQIKMLAKLQEGYLKAAANADFYTDAVADIRVEIDKLNTKSAESPDSFTQQDAAQLEALTGLYEKYRAESAKVSQAKKELADTTGKLIDAEGKYLNEILTAHVGLLEAQGEGYEALRLRREMSLVGMSKYTKALMEQTFAAQDKAKVDEQEIKLLELQGRHQEALARKRAEAKKSMSEQEYAAWRLVEAAEAEIRQQALVASVLESAGQKSAALVLTRKAELTAAKEGERALISMKHAYEDLDKVVEKATKRQKMYTDVLTDLASGTQDAEDMLYALYDAGALGGFLEGFSAEPIVGEVERMKTESADALSEMFGGMSGYATSFEQTMSEAFAKLQSNVVAAAAAITRSVSEMGGSLSTLKLPSAMTSTYGVSTGGNAGDIAYAAMSKSHQSYVDTVAQTLKLGDAQKRTLSEILPLVDELAQKYGIAREAILAVIDQESRFYEGAVSKAGAVGLMQIMPGTAEDVGRAIGRTGQQIQSNWTDNLKAGVYYLDEQLKRFGSLEKALHAYNAGPGRAQRGVLPEETAAYIPSVMEKLKKLQAATGATSVSFQTLSGMMVQAAVDSGDLSAGQAQATASLIETSQAADSVSASFKKIAVTDADKLERDVGIYNELSAAIGKTAKQYDDTKARITELNKVLGKGGTLTDEQIKEYERLGAELERLGGAYESIGELADQAAAKMLLAGMKTVEVRRLEGEELEALSREFKTLSAQEEEYALLQVKLAQLYQGGKIKLSEMSKALSKARDEITATRGEWSAYYVSLKQSMGTVSGLFIDTFDQVRVALVDGLAEGKLNFDNFITYIKKRLIEMAINTIVINFVGNIAGVTGAGAGSGGTVSVAQTGLDSAKSVGYLGTISKSLTSNSIGEGMAKGMARFGVGEVEQLGIVSGPYSKVSTLPNWQVGAAGLGGGLAGGWVANQMFEGEYTSIGSSIGSAVGATAAPMIAGAIGLGPVGWAGLAAGAFLGAVGGGGIGSLFGGDKPKTPRATLGATGGWIDVKSTSDSWGDATELYSAVASVNQSLSDLQTMLGGAAWEARSAYTHPGQVLEASNMEGWINDIATDIANRMIDAAKGYELTTTGSDVFKELMQDALAAAGDDPKLIAAAIEQSKTIYAALTQIVDAFAATGRDLGPEGERIALDLATWSGGLDAFNAKQASYYENFFSEEERAAHQRDEALKQIKAFNDAGWSGSAGPIDSSEELRQWTDSLDLSVESQRRAYVEALNVHTAFLSLDQAMEVLSPELESLSKATEDLARAEADLQKQREEVELRLIGLEQGKEAELQERRLRELDATDESLKAMRLRVWALEDEAAALEEAANKAEELTQRLDDAQSRLTQAQDEVLRATLGEAAYLAQVRQRELAGVDEVTAAMLQRIYALEDEASALERAKAAAEQRADLEIRLMRALGNEAGALAIERGREVMNTDPANRGLLLKIYAAEDYKRSLEQAYEELQKSADAERDLINSSYDAKMKAIEAEREAINSSYDAKMKAIEAERDAIGANYDARIDAIDAERDSQQRAHELAIEAINAQQDAANEALSAAQGTLSTIQSALDSMRGAQPVDEITRAMAARDLAGWAQRGELPDQEKLERTLDILAKGDPSDFASQADYLAQQGEVFANLLKLEKAGVTQVDWAQQTVDRLDQQIEDEEARYESYMEELDRQAEAAAQWRDSEIARLEQEAEAAEQWRDAELERLDQQAEAAAQWRDAELERLDAMLEAARTQIESASQWQESELANMAAMLQAAQAQAALTESSAVVLTGMDVTLRGIAETLLNSGEDSVAEFAPLIDAISTRADTAEKDRQQQTEEIAALRAELVLLRKDMAAASTAQVSALRDVSDRTRKWDLDGLPPERSSGTTSQTVVVLRAG